jgi:hypothetical protein
VAERFPIERELVPAWMDVPDGLQRNRRQLTKGLPERIELDARHALVVVIPTGVATLWRDTDPTALVVSSEAETAPWAAQPTESVASLERPPLRLLLLVGGDLQGAVPIVAGLHRRMPDGGTRGAALELAVISYAIHAGSMRAAGDYGSFLEFAWRTVGAGTTSFETPPLDRRVAKRLAPRFRLESELGAIPRPLPQIAW